MPRRAVLLSGLCRTAILIVLVSTACAPPAISDEELAQRVAGARFDWQNYHEDIKAQMGATPAAEWQGEPVKAWRDAAGIHVEFSVQGPWSGRRIGLPILMRDPAGTVQQSTAADCQAGKVSYAFPPSTLASSSFDFIELKYPHGERRMVLEKNP